MGINPSLLIGMPRCSRDGSESHPDPICVVLSISVAGRCAARRTPDYHRCEIRTYRQCSLRALSSSGKSWGRSSTLLRRLSRGWCAEVVHSATSSDNDGTPHHVVSCTCLASCEPRRVLANTGSSTVIDRRVNANREPPLAGHATRSRYRRIEQAPAPPPPPRVQARNREAEKGLSQLEGSDTRDSHESISEHA
jgi:hypothetical protein